MKDARAHSRRRLKSLFYAWMAVTVVILSAACAKKSGGSASTGAPTAPASPQAPGRGQPGGTSRTGSPEGPGGSSTPSQEQNNNNDKGGPIPPTGSTGSVIHYDPSGKTAEEIFAQQGSGFFGMPSDVQNAEGQPLFNSGSGIDSLHEQLRQALTSEQVSDEQRALDSDFAKNLSFESLSFDSNTGRVKADILYMSRGRQHRAKFGESIGASIRSDRRFEIGDVNKAPYVAFSGRCLDYDGGCQTMLVKVQDRAEQPLRTAYAIWRETKAYSTFEGPGQGYARNEEYDRFYQFMKNTKAQPGAGNGISDLRLSTYEVIGGESKFWVRMTLWIRDTGSNDYKETLNWTGPLVKPADGDRLSVEMKAEKLQVSRDISVHPERPVAMRSALVTDTIRDLRLLRNDGRGNLQIGVTIRAFAPTAREESMTLTVARIHKPVRQLPPLAPRPTQSTPPTTVPNAPAGSGAQSPCGSAPTAPQVSPCTPGGITVPQPTTAQPAQPAPPAPPQPEVQPQPQVPQTQTCPEGQPCPGTVPPVPSAQTAPAAQVQTCTQTQPCPPTVQQPQPEQRVQAVQTSSSSPQGQTAQARQSAQSGNGASASAAASASASAGSN